MIGAQRGAVNCRRFIRAVWFGALKVLAGLTVLYLLAAAVMSVVYGVSYRVAAHGLFRQLCEAGARAAVAVYDPCQVRTAVLAPGSDRPGLDGFERVETVLPAGRSVATATGVRVTARDVRNEHITPSQHGFGYQPYDEPRLHELRRKYRLADVVAPARSEFESMVRLRTWARQRFRRSDYQPLAENFDALEVLDRDLRGRGEPYKRGVHFDPCQFFPLLYGQVLLSVGHQPRLVSVGHGMVEVWSNQFRKWVLMDAELDHHVERHGVPLNMCELLEENFSRDVSSLRVLRGELRPGDENPTMAFLNVEHLTAEMLVTWFNGPLHLVDMRNDWMTNHYFRGHPARGEANSLIYLDRRVPGGVPFDLRSRPRTSRKDDMYWTLNQTEILAARPESDVLDLAFRTVTPNFAYYEIVTDGDARTCRYAPSYTWRLHEGTNTLTVRSVNQFGVAGVASEITLSVLANGSPAPAPAGPP